MLFEIVRALSFLMIFLGMVAYTTLAERKVAAWMQGRVGPNRAGWKGILQPLFDGVKFIFKEDFIPGKAHAFIFRFAPLLMLLPVFTILALIPLPSLQVADPGMGLLIVLGLSSTAVYGIILGGWSSANLYSFRGAMRASAQMISYEIPMGLSLISLLMLSGSVQLSQMVLFQAENYWLIFAQPLAFMIFFIASLAEAGRVPFDLPEAEAELVGGFHTEYSGFRFALFYLGEYSHMLVSSMLMSTLFLGGYSFPGMNQITLPWLLIPLQLLAFFAKTFALVFVIIWIRWTLPRFRYDQLMSLCWKVLMPLALLNILLTGFWILKG